jgi:hypothetical protein
VKRTSQRRARHAKGEDGPLLFVFVVIAIFVGAGVVVYLLA